MSIAIGPDGSPGISYGDGLYFGNMMFARKTGDSWTSSVVARGSMADAGQFSSLAFDRQGVPHITYSDVAGKSLIYATRSPSGIWSTQTVVQGPDLIRMPFVALSPAGSPGIAYYDLTSYSLKFAQRTG
jgi:hypothetical protein